MPRLPFVSVLASAVLLSIGRLGAAAPVDLGVLTPFYRSAQLQGHIIGAGLMEIPDYVLGPDVDFAYRKRPGATQEVPFTDSFTIVRFLGGYREDWLRKFNDWDDQYGIRSLDYAIRQGGTLKFRPELIQRRLAPYIDAGYAPSAITLALDNVPSDLARSPEYAEWGQRGIPADMNEWRQVISHFATDLKAYLGSGVSQISFKTGVEFDQKASFDGGESDFFAYYTATSEGLHAVLPDAVLSPGEFTAEGTCQGQRPCVYDTRNFVQFAAAHHYKYADIPRSLNDFLNHGDTRPSVAVARAVESYAHLPSGTVPEIHQFGLMYEPFGKEDGSDPGPLRANFEFQALMGLWENLHPRRVFHWDAFTPVGQQKFLNGVGFVRLVLDHYLGYHAYRLSPTETSGSSAGTELMAVNFRNPTTSAVVISSYSPSMAAGKRTVRVEMPMPHGRAVKTIRFRASDNVFQAIRADLARENNLKPEFARCPSCLGPPVQMGADVDAARNMLRKNWPTYEQIMKRDLKWNPSDGNVSMSGNDLVVSLEYNELMVVEPQ